MPIQLNEENGGKILVVHVSGKLAKADYKYFAPEFERLVQQCGKPRVLFELFKMKQKVRSPHCLEDLCLFRSVRFVRVENTGPLDRGRPHI